jgi:hypothetical protein
MRKALMAQLDLFGSRQLVSSVPQPPDINDIRALLNATLEQLRGATEMPWRATELNSWRHVFQNMTKWLPFEEGEQLRRAFEEQNSRLKAVK